MKPKNKKENSFPNKEDTKVQKFKTCNGHIIENKIIVDKTNEHNTDNKFECETFFIYQLESNNKTAEEKEKTK